MERGQVGDAGRVEDHQGVEAGGVHPGPHGGPPV